MSYPIFVNNDFLLIICNYLFIIYDYLLVICKFLHYFKTIFSVFIPTSRVQNSGVLNLFKDSQFHSEMMNCKMIHFKTLPTWLK